MPKGTFHPQGQLTGSSVGDIMCVKGVERTVGRFLPIWIIVICRQSASSAPLYLSLFFLLRSLHFFLPCLELPLCHSLSVPLLLCPLLSLLPYCSWFHPCLVCLYFRDAFGLPPFPSAQLVWESAVRWKPWQINLRPSAGGGTDWLAIAINVAYVFSKHLFSIWEMTI